MCKQIQGMIRAFRRISTALDKRVNLWHSKNGGIGAALCRDCIMDKKEAWGTYCMTPLSQTFLTMYILCWKATPWMLWKLTPLPVSHEDIYIYMREYIAYLTKPLSIACVTRRATDIPGGSMCHSHTYIRTRDPPFFLSDESYVTSQLAATETG